MIQPYRARHLFPRAVGEEVRQEQSITILLRVTRAGTRPRGVEVTVTTPF